MPSFWAFFINYIRVGFFRKNIHLITNLDSVFFIVGLLTHTIMQAFLINLKFKPNLSLSRSESLPIFIGVLISSCIFILSLQFAWYKRHKKGGE